MTPEQLQTLRTEIDANGFQSYVGLGDVEVAGALAVADQSVLNDAELPTWRLFGRIDKAEYSALANAVEKTKFNVLGQMLGMGTVNPADNNLRDALIFIFGGGSTTISNLAALRNRTGTRYEKLGIPKPTPSDVANARRL